MKLNKFSSIFRVYFSWSTEEQSGKVLERKVLQTTASIKNTGGRRLEGIEILSVAISYVEVHTFRKLAEGGKNSETNGTNMALLAKKEFYFRQYIPYFSIQ